MIAQVFLAGLLGTLAGRRISWAIRAWPGHEMFHCDYLACPSCRGGLRRGCYNAGTGQDWFYLLFSAGVAMAAVGAWGIGTRAALAWLFSVSCLIITVVDYRFLIIPDTLSINGCWLGLLYAGACSLWVAAGYSPPQHMLTFKESFLGFLLGGGSLWVLGWLALILLKKEGMGGGDVKLLAAIGAWMGWQPVIGTVVIASFLGSVGGIGSILYRKIRYGKEYRPLAHMIPFGPYLCIGFLFIFFFGMQPLFSLMNWYQGWIESRMLAQ